MYKSLFIAIVLSGLTFSCSNKPELLEAVVHGKITVADSLDATGDFSGIELLIVEQEHELAVPDTIMRVVTDTNGVFQTKALFPEKRFYGLTLKRYGGSIGNIGVILADGDSLRIEGELPDIASTISIQSNEHKAMETFNRVNRTFQRVSAFIEAGAVADSMLAYELDKWSNSFWEVYEKHENTLASYLAAEKSASLLNGWQNDKMMSRIDEALPGDFMIPVALRLAKPHIAETKGFDAANRYLDSLSSITESKRMQDFILRDKIKMHYDSSRIQQAKSLLTVYEEDFTDDIQSQEWLKYIRYDINFLSNGVKAPEFEFISLAGDTINNTAMAGSIYILEISPLANAEYQNDFDRTMVIYQIYKNQGLNILTIPLDKSERTAEAFVEEIGEFWPVARPGTFDAEAILKDFNITQVPARLLIDENGMIIRKYVRNEFQDVIEGLNKAFQTKNPS